MARKEATRKLNLADEIARMDAQGIIHGIRHEGDLDEAPGAYKDIAEVMAYQDDLVDILVELSPMAVIKG
jgi:tRNA-splicing ligase RtcB